jgi:hypothetical protein
VGEGIWDGGVVIVLEGVGSTVEGIDWVCGTVVNCVGGVVIGSDVGFVVRVVG